MFIFEVNQNGTGNEEFVVQQSQGGQQCNQTTNQRNGYMEDIFAFDLESDGLTLGGLSVAVNESMKKIENTEEFIRITGCAVPRGT